MLIVQFINACLMCDAHVCSYILNLSMQMHHGFRISVDYTRATSFQCLRQIFSSNRYGMLAAEFKMQIQM